MTNCTCRTCNCSEEEIAEYREATAPIGDAELSKRFLAATEPLPVDAEKIRAAFAPKDDALVKDIAKALSDDEASGEYDLTGLKGRRFYHGKCDVVTLLGRALDWLEGRDICVLDIRYDNSIEGGRYSESITVVVEEG